MFTLDTRSRVPIYEQLVDQLKKLMMRDVMQPDEQLPSVRSLAQELTINPNTIQKAYRELEREGFIYSVPGKGSFVAPFQIDANKERLEMLKQDLERIVSEILFLGGSKGELIELIEKIKVAEREDKND
ncbi:GntR family transcriptional regulator [Jeotgalibacillus proteolyticus]|uniref:GntR family transcriptional regulator n=1 Tax=Jeotgalibacillus proteolyticus TaxID=2082395 RepID=A0A2S5GCV4_9BACL|nr:GntR family transcriptional regulator [Jeotgalibacillus proteolyticus]PPA70867.1 GntR family transcriptional regulator [Jeotgalibacillus proteolyticus]